MRLLGVDFGLKRVGLALTDPAGTLAYPLKTVERGSKDALYEEIRRIVAAERVERVVVGLPLGLDGEETLTTRQARNFAASLARRLDVPVDAVDETLSSVEAESRLRQAGERDLGRLKARLDSAAAVVILETYLAQGASRR